MPRPLEFGEIVREPDPPNLPQIIQVPGGFILAFLSDGFLLIDPEKASKRIIHDTLCSGTPRTETPIFPLKIPCVPGLRDRVGLLGRMGFAVEVSGNFAVVKSLPRFPWHITPEALESFFAGIVDLPPLALDEAIALARERLALSPERPISPRAAAEIADALFSSDNPFIAPGGGMVAVRFRWKDLAQGIT
ncbi:MAG: hypothetical protein ABIM74_01975 [candidate division WOR-3 bacterium]